MKIGIILRFVSAIILAFSIGNMYNDGSQIDETGGDGMWTALALLALWGRVLIIDYFPENYG